MKVDRRSFLSLVIGGAAGTALTPLPWKLVDDSSIWSQMWPWTPVPPDGEVTYAKTTCTLCPGGCGITVRLVDKRAVKIEGVEKHPVNDGGICILGASGLQLLYGPARVQTPLKRVGPRGEGKFEPISWKQAISEVVGKLKALREKGEAHTVAALVASEFGTVPQLFSRFLQTYGSPNFITHPTFEDAYQQALYLTQGSLGTVGFDLEKADFVLSLGSGIIDGWGAPVRGIKAHSIWKEKKVPVVQVESRLSNTAAKSDQWISINPGTEADLALGLANVLINEKLNDVNFVVHYASGFDKWQQNVLKNYTPEKVAAITGIEANVIINLAKSLGHARRPLVLSGKGQGNALADVRETLAVHCLNALIGNLSQPGGLWAMPEMEYINWPEVQVDETAAAGMEKGRLDEAGSEKYPNSHSLVNRFFQKVAAEEGYPIGALLVHGANPCHSLPDTRTISAAIDKIPYVVSFSAFMDETTKNADIILPDHTNLERYQDVPICAGFSKPAIGLSQPVVPVECKTQHVGDSLIQISKGLEGFVADAFYWDDYLACLKETLKDKWKILQKQGIWVDEKFRPRTWSEGFDTNSGKFEFANNVYDSLFAEKSNDPQGDGNKFPLIFMPYDSIRITNRDLGNPPFMVKALADTIIKGNDGFVEIHPNTARKVGLSEGALAKLSTPVGEAQVRIHLFDGIMPGVVAMPRGLGHTAFDKYIAHKGVNVNQLIGPVEDPASGYNAAWGIRALLSKA
ncbi:MAG: molybdopterin-dependent oxidoreductase [Desulfobacteraceae bacterium]|jgi:anaerobic selenocysteine-containing dehydrogenase